MSENDLFTFQDYLDSDKEEEEISAIFQNIEREILEERKKEKKQRSLSVPLQYSSLIERYVLF